MNGWIKLHRKIWDNPIVTKDADYLAVWIYLLTHATHQPYDVYWQGQRKKLSTGQLITGRKKIAQITGVDESKVRRILEAFKNDHQIDQQVTSQGSLISILTWDKYQQSDQQNDQQVTIDRPTSDQQVTTIQEYIRINKNDKELKEDKEEQKGQPTKDKSIRDILREKARRATV